MDIDIYTVLWLAWFVLFFAIEIPAMLRARRGGTLSEHVWAFISLGKKGAEVTRGVQIRRILFMSFWAWLTAHFFFQFA